jgi:hypothetical protein
MAGYEQVHAGDIVLGHDGELWGVASIDHAPQLAVTLVRPGHRVTGYPPRGTPVTVVQAADVQAEAQTADILIGALGPIEILGERWNGT